MADILIKGSNELNRCQFCLILQFSSNPNTFYSRYPIDPSNPSRI
jgi:hypothetical protein